MWVAGTARSEQKNGMLSVSCLLLVIHTYIYICTHTVKRIQGPILGNLQCTDPGNRMVKALMPKAIRRPCFSPDTAGMMLIATMVKMTMLVGNIPTPLLLKLFSTEGFTMRRTLVLLFSTHVRPL